MSGEDGEASPDTVKSGILDVIKYWVIPMSIANKQFQKNPESFLTSVGVFGMMSALIFALNDPVDPTFAKSTLTMALGTAVAFLIHAYAKLTDQKLSSGVVINGFACLMLCMLIFIAAEVSGVYEDTFIGARFDGFRYFAANAGVSGLITFILWFMKSRLFNKTEINSSDLFQAAQVIVLCIVFTALFAMIDISSVVGLITS